MHQGRIAGLHPVWFWLVNLYMCIINVHLYALAVCLLQSLATCHSEPGFLYCIFQRKEYRYIITLQSPQIIKPHIPAHYQVQHSIPGILRCVLLECPSSLHILAPVRHNKSFITIYIPPLRWRHRFFCSRHLRLISHWHWSDKSFQDSPGEGQRCGNQIK